MVATEGGGLALQGTFSFAPVNYFWHIMSKTNFYVNFPLRLNNHDFYYLYSTSKKPQTSSF